MKFLCILCIAILSGCVSNLKNADDLANKRSISNLGEHEVVEIGLYAFGSKSPDTTLVFYGSHKGFVEIYGKTRWGTDNNHPLFGMNLVELRKEREELLEEKWKELQKETKAERIDPFSGNQHIDPFAKPETELRWHSIGEQTELHPISEKEIDKVDRLVDSFRNHYSYTLTTEPNFFLVRHYQHDHLIAEEFYRDMSVDDEFKIIHKFREKIQP